jgi:hypothetical protein
MYCCTFTRLCSGFVVCIVGRLARLNVIVGDLAAWRGFESFSLVITFLAYGRESLESSPCLSKVKVLFEAFADLNSRLDRDSLRVRRPDHVIFFCGGRMAPNATDRSAYSLRDYVCRIRNGAVNIGTRFVLAETAQALYRDTSYRDLISFEEDIARIASVVLVISESAGSLAELGAFASEPIIRESLRIVINEAHEAEESFVRFGPIKRIQNINNDRIGVFPWRSKRNGQIVKASAGAIYSDLVEYIKEKVEQIPDSYAYSNLKETSIFYDIIWILNIFQAIPSEPLYEAVKIIHPNETDQTIRNKIFCLRIAGWIDKFPYSNKIYYYNKQNEDPFQYAFLPNSRVRDVAAAKLTIASGFKRDARIPNAVQSRLLELRPGGRP